MAEKSEVMSTKSQALRAASLPPTIATLQSASFMAGTSFTPSPVMQVVCPFSPRARIKSRFCWGDTRPNTVYSSASACRSAPGSIRLISTAFSCPSSPAAPAMALTVSGSSPEMTFRATPCSRK